MKTLLDEISWLINNSNFYTKGHILNLMVNFRKIMEMDGSSGTYPFLRLYCDWCVHGEIDRSGEAFQILKEVNEVVIRETEPNRPSHGDLLNIASHLHTLRDELIAFCNVYGIKEVAKFEQVEDWKSFGTMLIYSLGDTKIKFPDDPNKKVKPIITTLEGRLAEPKFLSLSFGYKMLISTNGGQVTTSIQIEFIMASGGILQTKLIFMTSQGIHDNFGAMNL